MKYKGLPWIGIDAEAQPHAVYVLFAPEQQKAVVSAITRSMRVRTGLSPVPGQQGLQTIILTSPPYQPRDLQTLYGEFNAALYSSSRS